MLYTKTNQPIKLTCEHLQVYRYSCHSQHLGHYSRRVPFIGKGWLFFYQYSVGNVPLGKSCFTSSGKHLASNNTEDHCKHFWSVLIECRLQDYFARPHYSFKCFFSSCILLSNDNHLHFRALFCPCCFTMNSL